MAPVTEITADNCKRHRPRNLLVMIITACGVLAWTGCHQMTHRQQQAEAEHHWKQVRGKVKCQLARQQFEGGHVDDAITTAREALGLDPASPESYVLLCRALLDKGDLAAARQVLGMAEELGLESAELSYMRGLISERSRNLTDALESYRRAGELEPGQRDYLAAEAECLVALGRVEEALDRVRDAHSRFDRDGTLDVLEAEIAMLLDRREEAVESFRRAMPLLGDNDVVAEEYGLLLVRTGHFAEAVSVLQPLRERAGDEGPGPGDSFARPMLPRTGPARHDRDHAAQLASRPPRRRPGLAGTGPGSHRSRRPPRCPRLHRPGTQARTGPRPDPPARRIRLLATRRTPGCPEQPRAVPDQPAGRCNSPLPDGSGVGRRGQIRAGPPPLATGPANRPAGSLGKGRFGNVVGRRCAAAGPRAGESVSRRSDKPLGLHAGRA